MKGTKLTRREFLKLGSAALLGVAAQTLIPARPGKAGPGDYEDFSPPPAAVGRIISWGAQSIRRSPTTESERLAQVSHDTIIPLLATVVGDPPWPSNPIWYQTTGGFIHSGQVQPVENTLQTDFPTRVRAPGFWAEVCVPFTEARAMPNSPYVIAKLYYQTVYRVVGAVQDDKGVWWYQLQEGITWSPGPYVRAATMRWLTPLDLAPLSAFHPEKRIEVDLSEQALTCYEGDAPVFFTRIASGVWDTPTPRGEFQVLYKRHTQRMIGDDYDLAGVAFPTYFTWSGVAIHGTYWHNDYGRPHSHGCLNVASSAARWVFRWADPVVPYSEHTRRTKSGQGTRVIVT
jgi:hypothetical protein